jgi:hypothetical protein
MNIAGMDPTHLNECMHSVVLMSHSLTVPSEEPDSILFPSLSNSAQLT